MFCRNCDAELGDGAIACTKCGMAPLSGRKFCSRCSAETNPDAIVCVACGSGLGQPGVVRAGATTNRTTAGICAILLGSLGIHKFIMGYSTEGVIMLLVTLIAGWFTFGIAGAVIGIIGVIEGITYLSQSDADFARNYIENKKGWF